MTDEKFKQMVKEYYNSERVVLVDGECIDFSQKAMSDVVTNGIKLDYNKFLNIQKNSLGKIRINLQNCYYISGYSRCTGIIAKKDDERNSVLFKKLKLEYFEGFDCIEARESHVWVRSEIFSEFQVGDEVEFVAEVYRYLKHKNGIILDYGLRNPEEIQKVKYYSRPTNEEPRKQFEAQLICETCLFVDHCNGLYCLKTKSGNHPVYDD